MSTNNTTPDEAQKSAATLRAAIWNNLGHDQKLGRALTIFGMLRFNLLVDQIIIEHTRPASQGQAVTEAMGHDEAINALISCAQTVTVLSYREVVEGYLKLRNVDQATLSTQEQASGEPDCDVMTAQDMGQPIHYEQASSEICANIAQKSPQDAAGDLVEIELDHQPINDGAGMFEKTDYLVKINGVRVMLVSGLALAERIATALRSQSGLVEAVRNFASIDRAWVDAQGGADEAIDAIIGHSQKALSTIQESRNVEG